MYQKENNQNCGSGSKIALLAGISAILVGLYFFTGEGGERNRKKAKDALRKAHRVSTMQAKKMKRKISNSDYYNAIEDTFEKYKSKFADVSAEELDEIKYDLQRRWGKIRDEKIRYERLDDDEDEEN